MQGRSTSKNILLASELVKNYNKSNGPATCTIKVDIKKEYDSVEWDFMLRCLKIAGFPTRYIEWVKGCITAPRNFVALNGSLVGYFRVAKV